MNTDGYSIILVENTMPAREVDKLPWKEGIGEIWVVQA